MKWKAALGPIAGAFLIAAMWVSPDGVAAQTYDMTGNWSYEFPNGWSNCLGVTPVTGPPSTVHVTQSGNHFVLEHPDGRSTTGGILGSRYHISSGQHEPVGAYAQSWVWNLLSSTFGKGRASMMIVDDESNTCSIEYDILLKKQSGCAPTDTLLCLQNGRFSVRVDWVDQYGNTGVGHAVPTTDDSGLFWFFSPNNMELLIKVLDGCGINNHYWVFFAATTDQEFTVTVIDRDAAQQMDYTNPLRNPADAVTDTFAFATCP